MCSDKSYLELPVEMLEELGFDLSAERMELWYAHRLYKQCPNVNCEWCARMFAPEKELVN